MAPTTSTETVQQTLTLTLTPNGEKKPEDDTGKAITGEEKTPLEVS